MPVYTGTGTDRTWRSIYIDICIYIRTTIMADAGPGSTNAASAIATGIIHNDDPAALAAAGLDHSHAGVCMCLFESFCRI